MPFEDEVNEMLNEITQFYNYKYCYTKEEKGDHYYFADKNMYPSYEKKYVIYCDDVRDESDINYYTNYSGSKRFNDLLDKYNLWYDWETPAIAIVMVCRDEEEEDEEEEDEE